MGSSIFGSGTNYLGGGTNFGVSGFTTGFSILGSTIFLGSGLGSGGFITFYSTILGFGSGGNLNGGTGYSFLGSYSLGSS